MRSTDAARKCEAFSGGFDETALLPKIVESKLREAILI